MDLNLTVIYGGDGMTLSWLFQPYSYNDGHHKTESLVFVEVEWDGKRLSFRGVEGPRSNGHCWGGAGQIDLLDAEPVSYSSGWDADKVKLLAGLWERWHLNDMRAGTPRQEAYLRDPQVRRDIRNDSRYDPSPFRATLRALEAAGLQPDDGYSYGSKCMTEAVPDEVIGTLNSFPVFTGRYPWAK